MELLELRRGSVVWSATVRDGNTTIKAPTAFRPVLSSAEVLARIRQHSPRMVIAADLRIIE